VNSTICGSKGRHRALLGHPSHPSRHHHTFPFGRQLVQHQRHRGHHHKHHRSQRHTMDIPYHRHRCRHTMFQSHPRHRCQHTTSQSRHRWPHHPFQVQLTRQSGDHLFSRMHRPHLKTLLLGTRHPSGRNIRHPSGYNIRRTTGPRRARMMGIRKPPNLRSLRVGSHRSYARSLSVVSWPLTAVPASLRPNVNRSPTRPHISRTSRCSGGSPT